MDDFDRPFAAPPTIFCAAVIAGILLGFIWPVPLLPLAAQWLAGIALIAVGVWTIRESIAEIGRADTTYDPFSASTQLVTSGIYRHSRNPGYLGLAIIQTGLAIALDNVWIAATMLVALLITDVAVIRLEEAKLQRSFGEAYTRYRAATRRWV